MEIDLDDIKRLIGEQALVIAQLQRQIASLTVDRDAALARVQQLEQVLRPA